MANDVSYNRISFLGERIKLGIANKQEKDEYMQLLYQSKIIPQQQYQNYISKNNTTDAEEVLKAALIIGAIALVLHLLFNSK